MRASYAFFGCAALIALAACGADTTTSAPVVPPPSLQPTAASVSIDQQGFLGQVKLDVREQATLTATVRDASAAVLTGHAVTWSSSAPTVATVSSAGLVIGVAPGSASITATSDGKSATLGVQVLALDLTSYQLSVAVTDEDANPVVAAAVEYVYYGARPAGCLSCNIPYGNFVLGTTDGGGLTTGHFVAAPEAMDVWAGATHAFAYVVTSSPGFQTDRRFVIGASTFIEPVHLHPMKQVTAGDSVSLTIESTDPVYQELDTSPAMDGTLLCRSFRVLAAADGVLTVSAVPTAAGSSAPFVELDAPDESDFFAVGSGSASKSVHAGDIVEVRVATTLKSGAPPLSFAVHTGVAR